MPTKYELDHIEERAAKEILELLSCAVIKYQVAQKRVPIRLRKKHSSAIRAFCKYIPKGMSLQILADVEQDGHGRPKKGGRITCTASMVPDQNERRYINEDEDEYDDEEDDEL